jgi:hypothetical protein
LISTGRKIKGPSLSGRPLFGFFLPGISGGRGEDGKKKPFMKARGEVLFIIMTTGFKSGSRFFSFLLFQDKIVPGRWWLVFQISLADV